MKEENEHIDNKSNLIKEETPLLQGETADEDTPRATQHSKITLASILGGDILGGKWFRKQFWYIVMVVAMVIVYVSNRYSCQQEMIQTKMLTDTLLDRRYKALTRSSQLKEKMRRSVIENHSIIFIIIIASFFSNIKNEFSGKISNKTFCVYSIIVGVMRLWRIG